MEDPKPKDKVEAESPPDVKKTREYREFRKLLKRVVKAPPMRRNKTSNVPAVPL